MKAEIYFPREGSSFAKTLENEFEDTLKKLSEVDVNIIYKTEINLKSQSILEALKVTDSGNENISLVVVADGVKEDNIDKTKEFFESIGIIEKVKRVEFSLTAAETEKEIKNAAIKSKEAKKAFKKEQKEKKRLEKIHKEQEKQLKKQNIKLDKNIDTKQSDEKKLFSYYAEHNGKIILLIPDPEDVNEDFNQILYQSIKAVLNPKKKVAFWKRFIPCSGDRPIDVVRKIVLVLAICTFVVSLYMLTDILVIQPSISDQTNNEIKSLIVDTSGSENSNNSNGGNKTEDGVLVDFKKLLEVNSDTIGWITVPNTVIDYVVVKPSENKDSEYYLYRDFYGNDSKYGTVFMDYRSTLESKNIILHGHHMQDGRMFANLTNYQDLDFYKSNPTFTFNTIYSKEKWKIVSIFKTNTLEEQGDFFNYLRGNFATDYDFLNFIYELKVRSLIDCPVDINENDTLVTLSTCAYDFSDFRLVIVARKVRDGESESVNGSKAKYNPNPLYPDVWYKQYGGTAPKVSTFQDAFNKGEIDWYDGKKTDWSTEDERLLARELAEQKIETIELLKEYIKENTYGEEEQKKIDDIIKQYTKKINDAEDLTKMNTEYNKALQEIDKIKSQEQQSREESQKELELKNARSKAIVELNNSIAGNTYRIAQAEQVNEIIDNYTDKINNETDLKKIEEYKKSAIKELAKIKTDDELRAEESSKPESSREESSKPESSTEESSNPDDTSRIEAERLAESKRSSINELENYLYMSNYYSEQQEQISAIISQYINNINNANSVDAVESLLSSAKTELDNVKTSAEINAESSLSESSNEEPSDVSTENSDESSDESTYE